MSKIVQRIQIVSLMCLSMWSIYCTADAAEEVVNKVRSIATALVDSPEPYDVLLGASIIAARGDDDAFRIIVSLARSGDSLVQLASIDTLVSIKHPKSLTYLRNLIEEVPSTMAPIMASLAINPREDALGLLQDGFASGEALTKSSAIRALAKIGDTASLERFRKLANDSGEKPIVRANAYYGLVMLEGGDSVEDSLLEFELSQDMPVKVQEIIAVSYGGLSSDRAKQRIQSLLNDSDGVIAMAALISGVSQGNSPYEAALVKVVSSGTPYQASLAAAGIRRIPTDIALRVTLKLIKCCDPHVEASLRLVESWAWIHSDVLDPIVQWGLAHPDTDVRLQTIWLTGARADQRYINSVIPYLDHGDFLFRGMSAWAIGQMLGTPSQFAERN